jgi:hypothetical protein
VNTKLKFVPKVLADLCFMPLCNSPLNVFLFTCLNIAVYVANELYHIPGDEMFSDTYKIKLVDEVLYEVYGKVRM